MTQQTSLKIDDPVRLLLRGIDSLYVSFYLDGLGFDWEELDYRKALIGQDRSQYGKIELGGREWALSPGGKFPYRYVLSDACYEIRLTDKMQPSCHVQFSSRGLWTVGLPKLIEDLLAWFDAVGTHQIRPNAVSRADFAFDFHLPVVDFTTESFVTRLTKDAVWREHGAQQSFQLGQGDVVVRLYDKVAEINQASGKLWFYELWKQQQDVWRIEFQVRRQELKKRGIKTLDDLKDHQGDLLRELCTRHTTLRVPTGDRNRARWPLHPLWTALQAVVEQDDQLGLIEAIDPSAMLNHSAMHQARSLYGQLKGLASVLSLQANLDEALPIEKVLARLPKLFKWHHHPDLWKSDVEERMDARRLGR